IHRFHTAAEEGAQGNARTAVNCPANGLQTRAPRESQLTLWCSLAARLRGVRPHCPHTGRSHPHLAQDSFAAFGYPTLAQNHKDSWGAISESRRGHCNNSAPATGYLIRPVLASSLLVQPYAWADQEQGVINNAILKFPKGDALCGRLCATAMTRHGRLR